MSDRIDYIDFETKCDLDISVVGTYKYIHHPSFEVVLLGLKRDDGYTNVYEAHELTDLIDESTEAIYSHGAFDYFVYCHVRHLYNWPKHLANLKNWRCSMSLGARYTLPFKLAEAGKALDLNIKKQPGGLALIKKICCPPFKYTRADMNRFISYCGDDVNSMYELIHSLPFPELTESEQAIWEFTQRMNERGLPVDLVTAEAIILTTDIFLEEQQNNLPDLTGGLITKVTQTQRIKKFCVDKGVDIPNTQAATVKEWLEKDLPYEVKEVLTLRSEFGSTAIKKFKTLRNQECEGRVHNCFRYYGAQRTGRWAGLGFQPHNMPRASVDNPEEFIEKFRNYIPIDNPIEIAKALIRPCICAPDGEQFLVSDFHSVENRDLAWIAQDEKTIKLFYEGLDQYKDMACFLYNVDYADVTSAQRWMGKIIILGCGYGMGHHLFQITAAGYGTIISLTESKIAVDAYRKKYRLIVKFWYAMFRKTLLAIKNPGIEFSYNGVRVKVIKDKTGRPWLAVFLHSGRPLLYMQPRISEGKYGENFTYMQVVKSAWLRVEMTPGKLTENICQAECRDLMAHGMINVEERMPECRIVGTIHDEAISLINESDLTDNSQTKYDNLLCDTPKWAKTLPLAAEGYIAKRYKKG